MFSQIALAAAALVAAPVLPQAPARPETGGVPAPVAREDLVKVALETEQGRIVLALDRGRAPITTANFLRYVDAKRLDGITFYRAMKLWEGTGLIQAGVRDGAKLFPPIKHEPTSVTGLHDEDGTISMARAGPNSARADFFITVGKISGFDAKSGMKDEDLGFAAFGHVVEGREVLKRLLANPVSPTAGAKDGMQGQMLARPVIILGAVRLAS